MTTRETILDMLGKMMPDEIQTRLIAKLGYGAPAKEFWEQRLQKDHDLEKRMAAVLGVPTDEDRVAQATIDSAASAARSAKAAEEANLIAAEANRTAERSRRIAVASFVVAALSVIVSVVALFLSKN